MSRRGTIVGLSLVGLAAAALVLAFADEPGEPGGALLFAPFVALLAFELGALVGGAAGVAGAALYALSVEAAGGDPDLSSIGSRLLVLVTLGAAIGWLNARLRERDSMFRMIVETSADLICTISPQSVITYVNPRARDMLGYEPEEMIGQPVTLVLDHEEAKGVAQRLYERRRGRTETMTYDIRLRHKDGREVLASASSTPFYDSRGEFLGSLAMLSDVTERRRVEQELRERERSLEEAQAIAHIGSWSWDIAENRIAWSDELFRIYGVDPQTFEASYEAYVEHVHPDDRQLVNEAVQSAYTTGEPFRFEHRVVRPDGEIRYMESRGAVFRDGGARPTRMAGTGLDITDRRLAEQELAAAALARRQATELNDNVVQGLVLAKYALDRGDAATAVSLVESTLAEARRMIDDLLGDADVQPGQLRREAAAGVGD